MIDAKTARELAGPSKEDHLSFIEQKIKTAAENKKHKIIIRDKPYDMWLYHPPEERREVAVSVIDVLIAAGFEVSSPYAGGQFVGLGLCISWEK